MTWAGVMYDWAIHHIGGVIPLHMLLKNAELIPFLHFPACAGG